MPPDDNTATDTAPTTPPTALRLPATAIEQLRAGLLQADDKERLAYGYCARSGASAVLTDLEVVPDDDLETSTVAACRATDTAERDYVARCAAADRDLFVVHSHPFQGTAAFSSTDTRMMANYRDWLHPLYPDTQLLFGVLGHDNLYVERLTADGTYTTCPVTVIGDWTLDEPVATPSAADSTPLDWQRYDRTIRALGLDGQAALQDAHVAVVGVGGIGSHVAAGLARLGVGHLTLVDPDAVERSNLPRLAGARPGDVGRPKVDISQYHCWAATPDLETTTVAAPVQEAATQLLAADVIVGCVDNVAARFWLNEHAVRHLQPYVDIGTVIELGAAADVAVNDSKVEDEDEDEDEAAAERGGESASAAAPDEPVAAERTYLQTIVPGVTACFDCLDRADREQAALETYSDAEQLAALDAGYVEGRDLTPEPAVLPLNLGAASLALETVVDIVTGRKPPAAFLRVDRLARDMVPITTTRRASCPTCGEAGVCGAGPLTATEHEAAPAAEAAEPDAAATEAGDLFTTPEE